jgi:glycosyltransferase involved in cell wall biosynthesis
MKNKSRIHVLTKRQFMNKDLLDDKFGRFRELPIALARFGYRVTGLCLSYNKKREGVFQDGPVRWQSHNVGIAGFGLINFISAAYRMAKSTDLMWAGSDSFYGIIACMTGKIRRVPFIFDIYDNFDEFFVGRLPVMRQLYHWAIRHSDALTTFSIPYARYLRSNYTHRPNVIVIENAVRKDLFRSLDKNKCRDYFNLPKDAPIIGTAGALYKKREVDLLFKAYKNLAIKIPNLRLALAGPRDSNLRIPSGEKIHDLGQLPFKDVPTILNALDVAVICYANDNYGKYCFPQKTREIMACDVPLVAANVGSLKEIFAHAPEWLYEPGDCASLERAIKNRIRDRRTGYEKPPEWSDMAKIFDSVITNVLTIN